MSRTSDEPTSEAFDESQSGEPTTALRPQWLRGYHSEWLKHDALAGVTLAAYAIPVSLAYASLAGVPPQNGVYCYLAGGLLYALFGSSRQLAIGPTSAISMLVGTTIATMGVEDPNRWAAIAALTALLVASFCAIAYLLRLSGLVSFISETILVGFKAGAALTIAMTQLPKLFGVPGGGEHFFERARMLGSQLGDTNWTVLTLGLVSLSLLLASDKLLPGRPIALFVVALSIAAVSVLSLGERGVSTVGQLPQGLPALRLPSLRARDIDGIFPLAGACFILAYIEGISAARTLAAKNGYEISPRAELLGLGAANLAAAFSQGFPVAGGLSQSAVNDNAGAKSSLSLVFASIALALCLLFLTGLLANLPNVVLAAIVLVAVKGLVDIAELRNLFRISRFEFSIAMVAFAGVLLLGILKGVLLAVIISLVMLLQSAARPHVAILGRIPGSRRFSDLDRHPDNEAIPGVLIFRPEGALLYFNADHVRAEIWKRVSARPDLQFVVCDLSNAPSVDVAGARMLGRLHLDFVSRGIAFRIVEARSRARDLLRAVGVEDRIGYLGRHLPLDAVLAEHEATVGNRPQPNGAPPDR
jgi:high affinity sulfate transporter 1